MDVKSNNTSQAVGNAASRLLITADELCLRTGLSLSTINRLVRNGRIRALQPAGKGGKRLFAPDAIEHSVAPDLPIPPITTHEPKASVMVSPRSGPIPKWQRS